MKIIKTVSTLIQYFQKHKGWVLERIFLLTLAIDWIYRIDLNCVDSKKTGTEHNQYRVRRARAGKGDEELLKLKLFLPFPCPCSLKSLKGCLVKVLWSTAGQRGSCS